MQRLLKNKKKALKAGQVESQVPIPETDGEWRQRLFALIGHQTGQIVLLDHKIDALIESVKSQSHRLDDFETWRAETRISINLIGKLSDRIDKLEDWQSKVKGGTVVLAAISGIAGAAFAAAVHLGTVVSTLMSTTGTHR